MSAIERLAQQFRALHCQHIAAGLPDLLTQAEANELSYPIFSRIHGPPAPQPWFSAAMARAVQAGSNT